jgi:hypothetical protein
VALQQVRTQSVQQQYGVPRGRRQSEHVLLTRHRQRTGHRREYVGKRSAAVLWGDRNDHGRLVANESARANSSTCWIPAGPSAAALIRNEMSSAATDPV